MSSVFNYFFFSLSGVIFSFFFFTNFEDIGYFYDKYYYYGSRGRHAFTFFKNN